MSSIWFFPPLAFGIVMLLVVGMSLYMRSLAFRGVAAAGSVKSYACGEDVAENSFSPDYSQFFSFAFFFSIMHVVALMIATMPKAALADLFMPALYLAGALVGLVSLLRR
jgi:NADH-quinone oxidoreductase subunit A